MPAGDGVMVAGDQASACGGEASAVGDNAAGIGDELADPKQSAWSTLACLQNNCSQWSDNDLKRPVTGYMTRDRAKPF